MNADPTILGDRETLELLAAQPELLAIADAVRATQREMARAGTARLRLLVAAAVVGALAVVSAFALTGSFGGQRAPVAVGPARLLGDLPPVLREQRLRRTAGCSVGGRNRCAFFGAPMADLFDSTITRTDGAISSIAVTVRGERVDSTARLEVHMYTGESSGGGRVVFSERLSLDSIPSPPVWGTVSEWTGTLSPSDWDGGCQNAVYQFDVWIRNTDRWVTEIQAPAFNCQRAVVGPTGSSSPTGG